MTFWLQSVEHPPCEEISITLRRSCISCHPSLSTPSFCERGTTCDVARWIKFSILFSTGPVSQTYAVRISLRILVVFVGSRRFLKSDSFAPDSRLWGGVRATDAKTPGSRVPALAPGPWRLEHHGSSGRLLTTIDIFIRRPRAFLR